MLGEAFLLLGVILVVTAFVLCVRYAARWLAGWFPVWNARLEITPRWWLLLLIVFLWLMTLQQLWQRGNPLQWNAADLLWLVRTCVLLCLTIVCRSLWRLRQRPDHRSPADESAPGWGESDDQDDHAGK